MKRFLRVLLVTSVGLLAVASTAVPAAAASPSAANLLAGDRFLRPGPDLAVFGIDLTSAFLVSTLNEVRADFAQVTGGGTFDVGDLETSPEGIMLWRDSSNVGAAQDTLDAGDTPVPSSYTFDEATLRATVTLTPAYPLPAAEEGNYTFFLTIRLSPSATDGDNFTVTLPSDAFGTATLGTSITPVTTPTITADETPPTVQFFSPPATQTDNLSWRISEQVTGVTPNTVAFRIHGTTTDLPAAVSYNAATRDIVVDPASPLTPGQPYDAILLPDGPGPIVDRAGNELSPDSRTFRASAEVSETAIGTTYNWRRVTTSAAYGGSYTVNNFRGAWANFTFTGTRITWYTITDRYQGKATVYIDGRNVGTVNNYSSTTRYRVPRRYSGLSNATHTITIRASGVKGSSAGRDARVAIDAFHVGGLYGTPNAGYSWATVGASGANGGAYRASRFSWSDMTFVFYGTGVDWKTIVGPTMGRAIVHIDGISRGVFDNYSGVTIYNYIRQFRGLSEGLHTLRIFVYGRNSRATDSIIAVDGFSVV